MTDEQKLLESLEAEAEAERDQLLADAKVEAEKVVGKARQEAERMLDEARRAGEKRGAVEVDRRLGLAQQEVNLAILDEKHRILDEVRGDLASRVGELRKSADYPDALKRWTEEIVAGMGDGITLQAHPDDVSVVKSVLNGMDLDAKVSSDSGITGGIRVVSADGKVAADNTLESRVARARERLDEVLGRELFKDSESTA